MSKPFLAVALSCAFLPVPALAQAQRGTPPERIDLTIRQEDPEEDVFEDCSEEQEAASISGDIIVCRKRSGDENRLYSKEEAERRYAEETAFKSDPKTPDFIRDCHDQGWPLGCFRMGKVPPPAYMIDFDKLPEAPPGSDADRIARGLAPRGRDVAADPAANAARQAELGLPPAPTRDPEVSPSGSASPAAEPQD